jgi:hypothetical protein
MQDIQAYFEKLQRDAIDCALISLGRMSVGVMRHLSYQ